MVGGDPEILGQTDPVTSETRIFDLYLLVASKL